MDFGEIKSIVENKFPGAVLGEDINSTPTAVYLKSDQLPEVCEFLRDDDRMYFDMLSCLTGIDNGPESNMEVVYNLYSIPFDHHLMIKVETGRDKPEVPSVSAIWKTALWHEREAYDLLGINFTGHPDLRRILLPEDWEGHPLRKDYKEMENYHGIQVKY